MCLGAISSPSWHPLQLPTSTGPGWVLGREQTLGPRRGGALGRELTLCPEEGECWGENGPCALTRGRALES